METIGKVLTLKELDDLVKSNDYELFDEVQVANFATDNLEDKNIALIMKSLKRVDVMFPNYKRAAFYVRERQVDWIEKGYGVYRDTILNRSRGLEGCEIILETFEKGRVASVGEIRTWNGKKYQKRSDGKWRPVRKGSGGISSSQVTKKPEKNISESKESVDESYVDDAINTFLDEKNDLARAIKKMPINSKTEEILSKIRSLVREKGYLTEQGVYNVLNQKDLKILNPEESPKLKPVENSTPAEKSDKKEGFSPENAYEKMSRDDMKALDAVKFERKPGDFNDIKGQDFEKFPEATKNALSKLSVVELPSGYGSSDKGKNSFWSDLPKNLQGGFFIGKASDGNYYLIDTQGYEYSRYVQRLDNFKKKGEEEPNVKPTGKKPSGEDYSEEEAIDLVIELASQDYQLFNDKKALKNINNIFKDSGMSADDFLDKVENELDRQADHLINEGEYDEEEIYEEHNSYLEVIKSALKLSNNSYK